MIGSADRAVNGSSCDECGPSNKPDDLKSQSSAQISLGSKPLRDHDLLTATSAGTVPPLLMAGCWGDGASNPRFKWHFLNPRRYDSPSPAFLLLQQLR
jgi:hypothetical protein